MAEYTSLYLLLSAGREHAACDAKRANRRYLQLVICLDGPPNCAARLDSRSSYPPCGLFPLAVQDSQSILVCNGLQSLIDLLLCERPEICRGLTILAVGFWSPNNANFHFALLEVHAQDSA